MTLYVTSDTHFGHSNIIRYCNRPFRDVDEMDRVIARGWNNTVGHHDEIIHCGDFCWRSDRIGRFIRNLNGRKTFIRGNHDKYMKHTKDFFCMAGVGLMFIHTPENPMAKQWLEASPEHWVVHGHHHNNKKEYPFINPFTRTVNVSVELTDYKPVDVNYILEKIYAFK